VTDTAQPLRRMAAALKRVAASSRLRGLHQEGGVLFLNWSRRPAAAEVAAVTSAWGQANHFIRGDEFLLDAPGQRNPFRVQ
jgi:hypothetical protein